MNAFGTWMLVFWLSVVVGVLATIAVLEITHQRRHPEQHHRRPAGTNRRRRVPPRPGTRGMR
jgi:hypothetical protein